MATITYEDGAVKTIGTVGLTTNPPGGGHGRTGPPLFSSSGGRALKVVTGTIAFDASYPTGGEDISDIFDNFKTLLRIWVDQPLTGAQTGKFLKVDKTTKKALLYTNASPAVEVTNASDQSAITGVDFVAVGIA
jgi:hypothetical protein